MHALVHLLLNLLLRSARPSDIHDDPLGHRDLLRRTLCVPGASDPVLCLFQRTARLHLLLLLRFRRYYLNLHLPDALDAGVHEYGELEAPRRHARRPNSSQ